MNDRDKRDVPPQVGRKQQSAVFRLLFPAIISLAIAFIPWWDFRSIDYIDRQNNILFIDVVPSKLYWFNFDGIVSKVMNEWAWHLFTFTLNTRFGLNGDQVLSVVAAVLVMTSAMSLVRWSGVTSIWLLINPIFIDFAVAQSRLALAISVLLLALLASEKSRLASVTIAAAAPFIHTSAVLFIFMIGTQVILQRIEWASSKVKVSVAVISGLIVSIVTGPLMGQILSSLEDRRAEYGDMSPPVLYSLFWVILFIYLFLNGLINRIQIGYYFYVSVASLSIVFFNMFFEGYSIRFVAACFPFIIASFFSLAGTGRHIVISGYLFMTVLLWAFWLT